MIVAIHQPNYLPWCGYFAKIKACDTFVFLDDAQLSKPSYVNRTRVRANVGDKWLSVPVEGAAFQSIAVARAPAGRWSEKHLRTLEQEYRRAPFFREIMDVLEPVYRSGEEGLAILNERFIRAICKYLGLDRRFVTSASLKVEASSDERLIEIVRALDGDEYLSGAGGENYQDRTKFERAGQMLTVKSYRPLHYETQFYSFIPGLSIVDALFTIGPDTTDLLDYSLQC